MGLCFLAQVPSEPFFFAQVLEAELMNESNADSENSL